MVAVGYMTIHDPAGGRDVPAVGGKADQRLLDLPNVTGRSETVQVGIKQSQDSGFSERQLNRKRKRIAASNQRGGKNRRRGERLEEHLKRSQ